MTLTAHVACMGEKCMQSCSRKSERKGPLERPRPRWEDNIKIDLKEVGLENIDWTHWAQHRD
jgi:hypothetical protein